MYLNIGTSILIRIITNFNNRIIRSRIKKTSKGSQGTRKYINNRKNNDLIDPRIFKIYIYTYDNNHLIILNFKNILTIIELNKIFLKFIKNN